MQASREVRRVINSKKFSFKNNDIIKECEEKFSLNRLGLTLYKIKGEAATTMKRLIELFWKKNFLFVQTEHINRTTTITPPKKIKIRK